MNTQDNPANLDHKVIMDIVQTGSSILDLGCGSGDLTFMLVRKKRVKAQCIDIDEQAVYQCVAKGLSVIHGDIDSGLIDYADQSFDYIILNQSLQQVRNLENVLNNALRAGRKVIVGFPNFVYYKARFQLFFKGKTPVTPALPYQWYNTPNLHFLSISDFIGYCREKNINIEKKVFISGNRKIKVFPNLLAQVGIFLISK
ncbi:methionine biosynthesis protein MetW [Candidatus Poribacteria bacterium]|nr:methionine biosynthesis protein MetW [Candidatus Poribacteria bacterium]